ncbi:helix-turn-helix domain-containing protein [Candidatus Bathyarchaeota archaeon]|jgi:DNA-binding transcriptional ArsR family regulator|nr:helix-turn-helix domain-containing protein [Candidatus Bathyarchaeota archaeon]
MSDKISRTVSNSLEETKERHKRYLRAMSNPIRRKIIRSIREGSNTIKKLEKQLEMNPKTLSWHIKILEDGYCLDKYFFNEVEHYKVTEEGDVVDYIEG